MSRSRSDPGWVSVDGRRLEVLDLEGDVSLRPVVLLHEGLGSIGLWRAFPDALAQRTGRRVVVYSRHGHGHSDNPVRVRTPEFFHEEARDVLPALFGSLGVVEPVLVGHSDGGSIALIYGGEAPVTGVVTLAAHLFVEDICIASIEQIRDRYVDGDLRARLARHHDDPDAAFWGWCGVWLDPEFRSWTLDAAARGVSCPCLVVQGGDDPYGTLEQVDRICAAVGESAQRLVVPGGHSPQFDAADEVVEAIGEFCSALP